MVSRSRRKGSKVLEIFNVTQEETGVQWKIQSMNFLYQKRWNAFYFISQSFMRTSSMIVFPEMLEVPAIIN